MSKAQFWIDIHTYVRMALRDQILQIVDPRLWENEGYALDNVRSPRQAMTWMTSVISVMNIGLACSMDSPKDQMSLKDASVELLKVRDGLTQGMIDLFFTLITLKVHFVFPLGRVR